MNIYDISEKAGVSIATVSRVINGSRRVSPQTREKVLRVMEACDFTPNAFARGLGLNTMRTIGLLCTDAADTFIARAISYLERMLRAHDYDCILCCAGNDAQDKQNSLELLLSKRVDAVILIGSSFIRPTAAENRYIPDAASRVPVMLLNGALDGNNIYCTFCDDRAAAKDATAHMLKTGSRDILYLYHSKSYSGLNKMAGYRDALTESGIPPREELMQACYCPEQTQSVNAVSAFLTELWQSGLRFDGVFTSNDTLAVGALKFALGCGLRVPEDIQVVGYNNSVLTGCSQPELSSVDNRLELLCKNCTATLLGVLAGEEMPKRTIFSGELIVRGSTRQA